jgi:hypothetical protein
MLLITVFVDHETAHLTLPVVAETVSLMQLDLVWRE